jgi:hypothetical protein
MSSETGGDAALRRLRRFAQALGLAALISGCSTDNVLSLRPEVDVGVQTAAIAGGGLRDLVPVEPYVAPEPPAVSAPTIAAPPVYSAPPASSAPPMASDPVMIGYPRLDAPLQSAPEPMPAEEVACRKELDRLGVTYQDIAPIHDGGCGIDHPVKVSAIGSVAMKPAATLRCEMAATFAAWTRKELMPSARLRYFSGVKTIHQGSSYSCRKIRGTGVASEHSKGNALDVMRIELANGRDIDVRKPGWFAFRQRGFLNTVRADGCEYFTTVLGPGYNYDHRNHFHFDLKHRRSGYRACR